MKNLGFITGLPVKRQHLYDVDITNIKLKRRSYIFQEGNQLYDRI